MHNLALLNGTHVYQIWNDGEITLQKAGSLLWLRSLHRLVPPLTTKESFEMPCRWGEYLSYAVVTEEDAYEIRRLMCQDLKITDPYCFLYPKEVQK